jgi:hypothetical protein
VVTDRRRVCRLVAATLLAVLGISPPPAAAQAPKSAGDDEGDRKFVESLQREDPASAERYIALRNARMKAMDELRRAQEQYGAGGPELRPLSLPLLKQAQRRYAESSLALLDFLDARNRRALATYQEEINRINRLLEEHDGMRAELGRLLGDH